MNVRARLAALAVAGSLGAGMAVAADAERGRALYEGQLPLDAKQTLACAACHRPSGLGNFEGRLAVPPISGPTLFRPFDRDTAHYFAAASRLRVRPAYDEAALGTLLRRGLTPDDATIDAAMPRYAIGDADLADLTAHLQRLSSTPPPGLDAQRVRLATITTPDADPVRRDAMLATLARFVERKNGQSRHEAQRSEQAGRTREMAMYRKFRVWELEHWALQGEPSTWAAQLAAKQAERPVYAVLAGLGRADWAPIDAFCERERLPCLLPLVEAGGGAPGFYSLHYHAGIEADARRAAVRLRAAGLKRVELWADEAGLAPRVQAALAAAGLRVVSQGGDAVVSLLAPTDHLARAATEPRPLAWLAGTHALGPAEIAAAAGRRQGWIVTPMRHGQDLDRHLQRARLWMKTEGLAALPADVVASTLQATQALGETLAHQDFGFAPEYLLELLEHGLENLLPWSPYPRLSIGPGQRIASKGSWVGTLAAGRVDWEWVLAGP